MSGVEVTAIVASIIAAFGSGMNVLKRMCASKKARKRDKQGAKLTQDELRVQQSLLRGPQQIRAEYDRNVSKLGHRFEIGDPIAHNSLVHTLIVLNTGLVNILNHALSGDPKAKEMSKGSLLGLSELTAADTINALGQLNKRLASASALVVQPQPQPSAPHRRKRKAPKQQDQKLVASRTSHTAANKKRRPKPGPLARGGWIRSKNGTLAVSSGSSTPRPAKQTNDHSSLSLTKNSSFNQREAPPPNPDLAQSCPSYTCGAHFSSARHDVDSHNHHSHSYEAPRFQEPEMLLASSDVFNTDFVPPRPPKIPLERPMSTRKHRPPSVATFLTASTKIGEIPEHHWLDRASPHNRPLPYVIPPPLEPEPVKRKARGFKAWWKGNAKEERSSGSEVQV